LIDRLQTESGIAATLLINAGNNFDTTSHDIHIAPPYIVRALELSKTEVIAPGVQELAYGAEKFQKLVDQTSMRAVSANVKGFMPYVILSKNNGKTKVLVTSVIDPELLSSSVRTENEITDPVLALRRIQAQVSHDLFVAVIHAGSEKISSVIEKSPGIDLVIDAISRNADRKNERNGLPPVVSNNENGMFVAYVDYDSENSAGSYFSKSMELRAVVGKIAQDPTISQLVKAYEKNCQDSLQQLSMAGIHPEALFNGYSPYLGSRSCNLCHAEINERWADSRHANAMDSLVRQSKQKDPDCLSCHVTGMADNASASEFLRLNENHPMAGVQCEACHGPGADHSRNPTDIAMLPVNEKTCIRCHTSYTDPDFDYSLAITTVHNDCFKNKLIQNVKSFFSIN
jgi:hypothetical protein